jgi:hypothetical protein
VFVKNVFAVRSSEMVDLFFSTIHLIQRVLSLVYIQYLHHERPYLASLLPREAPLGLVVASFPIARVLVINSYMTFLGVIVYCLREMISTFSILQPSMNIAADRTELQC